MIAMPEGLPGGAAAPAPPILIDTHAHLANARLAGQLPDVLERARSAGVRHVVAPGTTVTDCAALVEIAARHLEVSIAVAIHPNDVAEATADDFDAITSMAALPRVVAIGETGLDRHWDRTPFSMQQESFQRHLDLAARLDLPIIIHCRNCYGDVIEQLTRQGRPIRGVLHSFTGNLRDATALLKLGLHLSFAGMITFANTSLDPLRAVAATAPADRILVETDSPYLTPQPHRGKRNEPAYTRFTAERLAELRAVSLEILARQTTANAAELFRLPGFGGA